MSGSPLISVGYQGRTVDDLVADLRRSAVTVVVDVRLTPQSRKPGMSKRRLAAALDAVGIRYVHARSLGNPKQNRAGFVAGEARSRSYFADLLRAEPASEELRGVAALADNETVALLCFERDHGTCHRQLVAEEVLRRNPTLSLVEL
jgi:uncharacterized protein (DUF488 family)